MTDSPHATQKIKLRWVNGFYWALEALFGGFTLLWVFTLLSAPDNGHRSAIPVGIFWAFVAVLGLGSLLFLAVFRPLTLTETELRIPRGLRTKVFPISEIAGVGLLYRGTANTRTPVGWALQIWDRQGARTEVRTRIATSWSSTRLPSEAEIRAKTGKTSFELRQMKFENQPDQLAKTPAGKCATRIYDFVLRAQGPASPLATLALQKNVKHDPWAVTKTIGWWSPDGEMGRIS